MRYVGGELTTAALLESLVQRGCKVDVYARYVTQPYVRNGVRVMNAGFLGPVVSRDYDLLITHPEIRTMAMQHADPRVPYVAIVHNTRPETMRSLERQPPWMTIANSQWTASKIPEAASRNLHVVRPPSMYRATPTPGEYVTLINMSVNKGVGMFTHLAQSQPLLPFLGVIGGYGAQQTIQPPNVLVGSHQGNMGLIYSMTKVLIVPSLIEAYGSVVAEAMQHGVPVIASDLPGIREAGGDAAVYVGPEDSVGWAHAVAELMGTPELWQERSDASFERGKVLYERSKEDLTAWGRLIMDGRCECGLVGRDDECQNPCGLKV